MARRPKQTIEPAAAVAAIKGLLDGFLQDLPNTDLRRQVQNLVPAVHTLRDLGSALVPGADVRSARDRIEHYLRAYPKTLMDGDELLVVSGIGEWARRVRELRVQFGWWIYSGVTIKEMADAEPELLQDIRQMLGIDPKDVRPDQYILINTEQDTGAAERWRTLNGIRKQSVGVKSKLLQYLRANVGRIVTGEELRYLAGDRKEWARRTRELRTEDGWPVYTKMQGRSDIPVGAYLLEEDKQAEPHDRDIKDDVRVEVLQRSGYKCSYCDWDRAQTAHGDPRKFLEIHHLEEHAKGGSNDADNLIALCNVHHDMVHRGELKRIGAQWTKVTR